MCDSELVRAGLVFSHTVIDANTGHLPVIPLKARNTSWIDSDVTHLLDGGWTDTSQLSNATCQILPTSNGRR